MTRRKKVRVKKRFFVILAVIIVLIVVIAAAAGGCGDRDKPEKKKDKPQSKQAEISVLCTGDLVMHGPVLEAAQTGDGYDFTQSFNYVKDYIQKADVSFVSLEAPLVESGYTGYPLFRSPDQLAKDLKTVGYDLVLTSSNHTNDAEEAGIFRTIKVLKEAGLKVAGSRAKKEDPRYVIMKANDVKVGIVSYVYGDGGIEHRDLNGNVLSDKARACVNTFGYDTFDKDIKEIKSVVSAARKEGGADVVIVYYHWGDEYQTHSNEDQQKIAKKTIEQTSADAIVGSHPHVPQEMAVFTKTVDDEGKVTVTKKSKKAEADQSASGQSDQSNTKEKESNKNTENSKQVKTKEVPVYYAMGNLISNQRREWMDGDRYTEQGYFVKFDISYDVGKNELMEFKDSTIPYWLDYSGSGPTTYTIIPLVKGFENNEFLQKSGNVERAKEAKSDIKRILAQD